MSFQITISANRRAAARFVVAVRRALQKAYAEEQAKRGVTQTAIAKAIGVHRSVINRELRGKKDLTLGRVAELAWALGRVPEFSLPRADLPIGSNLPESQALVSKTDSTEGTVMIGPLHQSLAEAA